MFFEGSFDSPARDEIIFLWLTIEVIESWISANHQKRQKLIHKNSSTPNVSLFCEIYFSDWQSPISVIRVQSVVYPAAQANGSNACWLEKLANQINERMKTALIYRRQR